MRFLKLPHLLAAVVLFAVGSLPCAVAAEKPNIIYILLDDAGYGDFSCYGQQKFETPNIDKIATEGMRFTNHYAGSTVCAPTRCSLMTGRHTGHCQIRGNKEINPEGQSPMAAGTVTLATLLKQAGYTTGAFGKWGLGAPGSEGDPIKQGFDIFYGYNCQRQAHSYYPTHLWDNEERVKLDGNTYSHDLIAERSLKFVREHKNEPFFCFIPTTIPHAAMHVPEEDAAPFRKKFPQFEKKVGKYAGRPVKNPVAAFAGMMTRLDREIGKLSALLEELEIDDNTIIFITSDNGPHKEGGHLPDFFNSNGGLRGHKRDLYEGGIRAPLIARWPGKIAANSTSDLISAHWDMLPTFCELAGIPVPEETDGISILPTLRGDVVTQKNHDFLYWEFHEQGKKQAIRMGQWKGVRLKLGKNPQAPIQLYDLSKDQAETKDISANHPKIVEKIKQAMEDSHTESAKFPFFNTTGKKKSAQHILGKKLNLITLVEPHQALYSAQKSLK
ncbi:MAG: arylsulfatase A [Verrucomicrobiales bacterium]|jgi:arylsulfatase A